MGRGGKKARGGWEEGKRKRARGGGGGGKLGREKEGREAFTLPSSPVRPRFSFSLCSRSFLHFLAVLFLLQERGVIASHLDRLKKKKHVTPARSYS